MAKADVLALVQTLALGVTNADEISNYYDEIVREIGFGEVLVATDTIATQAGDPFYVFAKDNINTLEVHFNHAGRLSPETGVALRASQGVDWRVKRGTPSAFTQDQTSSNDLRLFPIPTTPGELTVIQTVEFDDILEYLELPVALEICHREFVRESGHQDVEFAIVARALSQFFFNLIDVGVIDNGST